MGNSLHQDIEGKHVLIKAKRLKPEFQNPPARRVFLAKDGFGTAPDTTGTALMGEFIADGETCTLSGYDVDRLATPKEIAEAKELKTEHVSRGACELRR